MVPYTEKEKDLSVWISSDLKPSFHCQQIVAKAMQTLGRIKCSFKFLSCSSFKILYRTYICPQLQFCVQVWYPYLIKDIVLLENVQRRATKLVHDLSSMPYQNRLKLLGLYSLYCRRQRGDLIEVYKILNNRNNVSLKNLFITTTSNRGHHLKLYKQRARTSIRQDLFSHQVIDQWNDLPSFVISAPTINSFKSRLDNYWSVIGYGYCERPQA